MNVSFLLFCKTVRPMLSNRFMSCLSVCNVGVLLPNGSMDTMPLDTDVGFGHGYILLDGDPAPPRKRNSSPTFRPMPIVTTVADLSNWWALINDCAFAVLRILLVHKLLGLLLWSPYAIGKTIIFMAALCNRGPLYFCPVVSFFVPSIFFSFLA